MKRVPVAPPFLLLARVQMQRAAMACLVLACGVLPGCGSPGARIALPSGQSVAVAYDLKEVEAPRGWRGLIRASPLQPHEGEESRAEVVVALQKYPPKVLQYLDRVILVKRLTMDGVLVGGTFYQCQVIINAESADSEGTFHHEFASVLHQHSGVPLREDAWHGVNPAEFEYIGSGFAAITSGRASRRGSSWYSLGFMSEYGAASFEDDFSTVAEALFQGNEALWDPRYPGLAAKRDLAIEFYSRLDVRLSVDYFHGLHEQRMMRLGIDPYPLPARASSPRSAEGRSEGSTR